MKSDYIAQAIRNITAVVEGHIIDHNKAATIVDMELLHNRRRHLHSSHHSNPTAKDNLIAIDFDCKITNNFDLVMLADIIVINSIISKSYHLHVYCLLLVGKMNLLRMCISFNTFDTSFLDSLINIYNCISFCA